MDELVKKLEEINLETEEGCIAILETFEHELSKQADALSSVWSTSVEEANKGRTSVLLFLDSAAYGLSLMPRSLTLRSSVMDRLRKFIDKML